PGENSAYIPGGTGIIIGRFPPACESGFAAAGETGLAQPGLRRHPHPRSGGITAL
ncbi:conserved hypothetical protein, partial [Ricinus communis]